MRTWAIAFAPSLSKQIAGNEESQTRRVLEGSVQNGGRCTYYGMSGGGDCVPAHSAVVYFVTGVAGMALILALTLFFVCCLCWRKRQRDRAEAAFLRQQTRAMQYPATNPLFFQPGGPGLGPDSQPGDVAMTPVEEKSPSVCVIMAGEEKPTFLAHPVMDSGGDLPTSHQPREADSAQQTSKPPS